MKTRIRNLIRFLFNGYGRKRKMRMACRIAITELCDSACSPKLLMERKDREKYAALFHENDMTYYVYIEDCFADVLAITVDLVTFTVC